MAVEKKVQEMKTMVLLLLCVDLLTN